MHLCDVAVGFKTLKTILQSVTHNGKQASTYPIRRYLRVYYFLLLVENETSYTVMSNSIRRKIVFLIVGTDSDAADNRRLYLHSIRVQLL